MKPLGKKAYGSIPHLPGSRVGIGDHHINEGNAKIATLKVRDKYDLVIVQEKLDGSNVCVAKINGCIVTLTRTGYIAKSSPFVQHHYFHNWVEQNKKRFDALLSEGERVCGEWLIQVHGTRYNLVHEPFVPFDILTGVERLIFSDFEQRVKKYNFTTPNLLHVGGSYAIETMLNAIQKSGHGAVDEVEGAVWRVERKGKVDFLCKYVHHSKQDGKYLECITGKQPVWNCDITTYQ